MKKVALLKSRLGFRGGLEKYSLRLRDAFAKAGCEVTLLTTSPIDIPSVRCIPVASTHKISLLHHLAFDAGCKKWLHKHPQDVIFGLERTTYQTHYRAGSGVHAIYLKRRALIDSFWKKSLSAINPLHLTLLHLEKKAFESPPLKRLFTNSEMVKEEILSTYNTSPEKISVIHNGVEWQEWEKPFRASLQKPREGPFHFLFIGNGYLRKGLGLILEAFSLIKSLDFHLSVVGKDKQIPHFQKLIEKLSLTKKVTLYGPQKEVLPFYQKADALVIPSLYDPFANVTVEALAMGLFVVSSAYNGGKEVLTPETGVIIEDLLSPESVASALKKTLDHPKTVQSAERIRNSIQQLDFSRQLDRMVQQTLCF